MRRLNRIVRPFYYFWFRRLLKKLSIVTKIPAIPVMPKWEWIAEEGDRTTTQMAKWMCRSWNPPHNYPPGAKTLIFFPTESSTVQVWRIDQNRFHFVRVREPS